MQYIHILQKIRSYRFMLLYLMGPKLYQAMMSPSKLHFRNWHKEKLGLTCEHHHMLDVVVYFVRPAQVEQEGERVDITHTS